MKELIQTIIANLWTVGPVLAVVYLIYKSIAVVRGNKIIILERRWFGKQMPDGRTVALKNEVGVQARVLGPGFHWLIPFIYKVTKHDFKVIKPGYIGVVSSITGAPIKTGEVMAKKVDCDLFQDGEAFLLNGGEKGPQLNILPDGEYKINPHLFQVEEVPATIIEEDEVGCVESIAGKSVTRKGGNFGSPVDCNDFQDAEAFITNGGQKGPQIAFLNPGYYRINTLMFTVEKRGQTKIAGGKMGLIEATDGARIPEGRLLGKKVEGHNNFFDGQAFIEKGGEKGRQLDILMPGEYRLNPVLFKVIEIADWTSIEADEVGIVTIKEGNPITDPSKIAAEELPMDTHNNFQDASAFVLAGGQKGLQIPVLRAGNYAINPWFASIEKTPMTIVEIGFCAVVTNFVGPDGEDVSGEDVNAKIVENGKKGIWAHPLEPGKHPLNTKICKVDIMSTTQILLNWADLRSSAHNYDSELKTITLRTADAFSVNMDVSVIIHIAMKNAPKVIANLGSLENMISQVLEPAISSHFRNSAQEIMALDLYTKRKELQDKAKKFIAEVLAVHHIDSKETLIADVVLPAELTKPVTDRQIAEQEKTTYEVQTKAQEERSKFENATAQANMQAKVVESERNVDIEKNIANGKIEGAKGSKESAILTAQGKAEATKVNADADSEAITKVGNAEAGVILAKGTAKATAYDLEVKAMGEGNFGRIKVIEQIAQHGIKLIPENIIVGGGEGGNLVENFLGISMIEKLTGKSFSKDSAENNAKGLAEDEKAKTEEVKSEVVPVVEPVKKEPGNQRNQGNSKNRGNDKSSDTTNKDEKND